MSLLRVYQSSDHCQFPGVEGFRMHKESFNKMGHVKVSVLEAVLSLGCVPAEQPYNPHPVAKDVGG